MEKVQDEVKNALAGGHLPSQRFAVNAAWFKLTLMAYHLASAIRGLCFSSEERTMRFKRYRLKVVQVAGRMSRFANTLRLRLCASAEVIAQIQRIWQVFVLPTQARADK
ncbi:MAG: transposase [Verrucomicrobiota bacterium]